MLNKLNHIALILDGNKRWAKNNNLSDFNGYTKGFENIKNLVTYALSKKISSILDIRHQSSSCPAVPRARRPTRVWFQGKALVM